MRRDLREQRHDGVARVAADHRHECLAHVETLELGHERVGAHHVQRGHAEHAVWREHVVLLEYLARDRHRRVHRVGDDTDERLGARLGDGRGQVGHNGRVHVEQIVTGHAWLARHTGRDDHHVGTDERVVQLISANERAHLALGLDVAEIGTDALRVLHIVQRELIHQRRLLDEQREWLTDAAAGAHHGNLSLFLRTQFYNFDVCQCHDEDE